MKTTSGKVAEQRVDFYVSMPGAFCDLEQRLQSVQAVTRMVTGNQPAFFPALFVLTRMPSWHHGMESRHGDDDQEVAGEARRGAVAGPAVAL